MTKLHEPTTGTKLAHVTQFFTDQVRAFTDDLTRLDSEIDSQAVPCRGDEFHHRVLKAFQTSQGDCRDFERNHGADLTMLRDVQNGFREETDPWFRQSWIANRARTKPSGFAGDFEMLRKLYDEKTPALGLGGYLDLCILDLPLAQAVRARLKAARAFLLAELSSRRSDVRILDIACGPCREYEHWPIGLASRTEIVAMDNDPEALAYVETQVASHLTPPTQLRPERYNALRTRSAETTKRKFGTFDIIYSVGLCDYLSDDHLIGMLSAWRQTLNPGGVLFIAFKDTLQYDKTPYQWHLDWFFYQRTTEDVLNLYRAAGFDTNQMEMVRDDTEIIVNYIDRLGDEEVQRVDAAETIGRPHGKATRRSRQR
ncbi:MAG: class I SAM-dependent methyltransferase [Planctomycetaceae bacterium]|nr:class I SAM-dependent methyltransferase [Planctomycetaceae bacterium]